MTATADPSKFGIERISATEAVFRALTAMIQSERYAVGDRLPAELALAREFGVSRSVVREALHACATLGLTETRTGSGTFLLAKTRSSQLVFGDFSAQDLIEARPHIEVPTAGYAAERRTSEQLANLHRILSELDDAQDLHTWVKLDGELHVAIAVASRNPVFISVVTSTRQALDIQSEFLNITQARQHASDVEHAEIVRAIESGSAQQARDAMSNHLRQVAAAVSNIDANPH
ncbi:FadR/GntR family transcriptional regulator [Saxibacter everestensis]|uniref:FadR/GntR family transcriptional regulator n=1 Tax=Saxibacter everestensis TaxID=2909229 RepID=A0ABY8QWE6_9MICO|nr:FadR/GntR family transcriptional regulator [Brevibacteriaceae bacterium ZFBP1038]